MNGTQVLIGHKTVNADVGRSQRLVLLKAPGAVGVEIDLSLLHVQTGVSAHIITLAGNTQTLLAQRGGVLQVLKMQGLLDQIVVLGGEACNIILNGHAGLDGALIMKFLHAVTSSLDAESVKYGPLGTQLGVQGVVQHTAGGYG